MAKAPTDKPVTPTMENGLLAGHLDPVVDRMLALARAKENEGPKRVVNDDQFATHYPNLFAWLTATQIADQYQKEPARLSMAVNGSVWEFSLTDSSLECSLSYTSNTFMEGLVRLEAGLSDPEAPWRLWKKNRRGLRKNEPPKNSP